MNHADTSQNKTETTAESKPVPLALRHYKAAMMATVRHAIQPIQPETLAADQFQSLEDFITDWEIRAEPEKRIRQANILAGKLVEQFLAPEYTEAHCQKAERRIAHNLCDTETYNLYMKRCRALDAQDAYSKQEVQPSPQPAVSSNPSQSSNRWTRVIEDMRLRLAGPKTPGS